MEEKTQSHRDFLRAQVCELFHQLFTILLPTLHIGSNYLTLETKEYRGKSWRFSLGGLCVFLLFLQHRVGSVHLRPFYDRNERAFHKEDIPPWAKKAREDILNRKAELLNPSKTPDWNPETNPNHKCERNSSRILEVRACYFVPNAAVAVYTPVFSFLYCFLSSLQGNIRLIIDQKFFPKPDR